MKKKIKYILWDVDGTLYKSNPELNPYFKQAYIKLIQEKYPKKSETQAWEMFLKTKINTHGSTMTVVKLTNSTIDIVGARVEKLVPKQKFIKKDAKLVSFFKKMVNKYKIKNIALRNGTTSNTKEILKLLGLDLIKDKNCELGPFYKVIGVFDFFKTSKPDIKVFKYFINKLKLDPSTILSIGDRCKIELEPAKKLGMQTALVWSKPKPNEEKYVDYVFPAIYNVFSLFKT